MRANSPSALFASLAIHAVFAVLVVLLSLAIKHAQEAQKPPVIFELVAGPPTSPFEKEAPALGIRNPTKLEVPRTAPKTPPKPEPVEEEEEETVAPPVTVKPPPIAPPKQTTKVKTEVKKPAPPKAAPTPKKMSYDDFKKKHGEPKTAKASTSPRSASKVPRINTKGITGGVVGGSTANDRGGGGGKALTREDMAEMDIYITALKNRLAIAHSELKPEGLGDSLSAEVEFTVSANGEISNIRIVRSSGNAEFDASVRESFRRITWMGARPDKRSSSFRLTFRMREID
jgi:colicin import membrane protein